MRWEQQHERWRETFFGSPSLYACSGIGRGRSSLKPGKIRLEPAQMKCNEKPQEAELTLNETQTLFSSIYQNLINKKSCTQTSLSIISVYPGSALLCFTCINRLWTLFEDKHHISVYHCTNKKSNWLQTRFIPAMHRGWSCFLLKAAEQEPVNSSCCRITKPLYNNIYTDLHKKNIIFYKIKARCVQSKNDLARPTNAAKCR